MQTELFKQKVILVTNDNFHKKLYEDVFTVNGYITCIYEKITEVVKNITPDIVAVIVDCDNENYNTLAVVITKIKEKAPKTQIVGMSIHRIKENKLLDALDEFLIKPIHLANLISALNKHVPKINDN